MAHLPPKVPNMIPNFSQQQQPQFLVPNINNTPQQQNSWIDEFLDFSSIKRGAHRRSASDSIAFLETPFLDEEFPRKNIDNNNNNNGNEEFDRLDEEQLFSMFSDDISGTMPHAGSSSNPSTPSDHNSINDEKPTYSDQQQQIKNESGDVQSQCHNNEDAQAHMQHAPLSNNSDQPFTSNDPKRVKRILANRQSAQRSRVRKLQYISELERSVTSLQTEVSALSPRVAFLDHQRLVLNVDNSALKQRIAALAQDKMFKDAQQEALRKEIERLRHLYQQQNIKKIGSLPNQGCTESDHQQIKGQEHVLC